MKTRQVINAIEEDGWYLLRQRGSHHHFQHESKLGPVAIPGHLSDAFEEWRVVRVDLKSDVRNERSRQAIERAGALFEGVLRGWQPSQVAGEEGRTRDTAMYSVIASEWPVVKRNLESLLARNQ